MNWNRVGGLLVLVGAIATALFLIAPHAYEAMNVTESAHRSVACFDGNFTECSRQMAYENSLVFWRTASWVGVGVGVLMLVLGIILKLGSNDKPRDIAI